MIAMLKRTNGLVLLVCILPLLGTGCQKSKGHVVAAKVIDVEKVTAAAMEMCDTNGDGEIDSSEIKASPALKFAKGDIDEDGNGKLSEDELRKRFQIYVDVPTGAQGITMNVVMGGRGGDGFMGATVRLIPEPFMEDYIEVGEGEVIDPTTGYVQVSSVPGEPGVRVGMYRVEITHDDMKVKSKYNENTIYGIEVPPITSAATSQPLIFPIK